MRVLIGCERSGVIRTAFRKLGHDAWSCDIYPCDDQSKYHLGGDARDHWYKQDWDLGIFHPPCTYLSQSGAKHLWSYTKPPRPNPDRFRDMAIACGFFLDCLYSPIPLVCVENPVMHGHAIKIINRQWSQIVQPWLFGDEVKKRTCLWLKDLPLLLPTNNVGPPPASGWDSIVNAPDSLGRSQARSRTFQGMADAMAEQWGGL